MSTARARIRARARRYWVARSEGYIGPSYYRAQPAMGRYTYPFEAMDAVQPHTPLHAYAIEGTDGHWYAYAYRCDQYARVNERLAHAHGACGFNVATWAHTCATCEAHA